MGLSDEELLARRAALMERDKALIAQVLSFGVDPAKPRKIDLTFWAPDEKAAKVFVEACKRNEIPPELVLGPSGPHEKNQRWAIRCAFEGSVNFMTAQENIEVFLLFADKFDCEYEGWGTAIVEAAS
jgi:regulator of RNase E activity RraB